MNPRYIRGFRGAWVLCNSDPLNSDQMSFDQNCETIDIDIIVDKQQLSNLEFLVWVTSKHVVTLNNTAVLGSLRHRHRVTGISKAQHMSKLSFRSLLASQHYNVDELIWVLAVCHWLIQIPTSALHIVELQQDKRSKAYGC